MVDKTILRSKLRLFHQSIGWTFCTTSGLEDVITGVDFNDFLVHGKNYGSFSAVFCELLRAPAKKPSSTILPDILEKRNVDGRYDALIKKAKAFLYDDFKFCEIDPNIDYSCPKVMLVDDLYKFPELVDLRQQAMDGAFDDEADEDDKAVLRKDALKGGFTMDFIKNQLGL